MPVDPQILFADFNDEVFDPLDLWGTNQMVVRLAEVVDFAEHIIRDVINWRRVVAKYVTQDKNSHQETLRINFNFARIITAGNKFHEAGRMREEQTAGSTRTKKHMRRDDDTFLKVYNIGEGQQALAYLPAGKWPRSTS